LLVLTAVCGLLLAPVAVEFSRYRHEQAAVDRLASRSFGRFFKLVLPDMDLGRSSSMHAVPPYQNPPKPYLQMQHPDRWYAYSRGRTDMRVGIVQGRQWFGLARPVLAVHLSDNVKLADIQALTKFTRVRHLEIGAVTLTRQELEILAQLTTLEFLDLSGCHLPDGVQPLAKLRNLKSINLQFTDVSASAVIELQQSLPGLEFPDEIRRLPVLHPGQ